MKQIITTLLLTAFLLLTVKVNAQDQKKDKLKLVEKEKGFYSQILQGIKDYEKKEVKPRIVPTVDLTGYDLPKSTDEFKSYWHNDPVSQGNTGTCWSFSTTSFFESEVYRLTGKKVKISPIFTVYWEYVEKAKRFVKERGDSEFGEGSESNAVTRIYKEYGAVPLDAYTGLMPGQKFHNHSVMFKEMDTYLQSLKTSNAWNEDEVVSTIKSILNHYLGVPPTSVTADGKTYTPKEYLTDYLKINPDDYVDVLSYMQQPFNQQVEYEVPDNWWHNKDYYNVPLDEFMKILKHAIRNGYTMAIGGDVSEAGKVAGADIAIVPTFDIPYNYIDDSARQFRFSNKTTTDDHGLHLIGYKEGKDGLDWFLIKDSGSSGFDGPNKGYYFFREDYVKLKMMDFMVHKDAVKGFIDVK